ncbi:nucleotidyltransferase domain-containing protein [Sphingomonas asaccharolytica]|uniref:nucleotidyltransferase domain-containing protein n=1 Tax=Sphingomonas asaccharolytica TaxID=40681 RepID=UPI00082B7DCC|nr:nucleotidyltransferase family protein [Sphingomonas asaccharolytica]
MARDAASPEFELIAACCRWPIDLGGIRSACTPAIDRQRLVKLARRHRVVGLVHHGLAAAGIAIPPVLTDDRRRLVVRNLLLAAEAVRVHALLTEAGVRHLFLKGAAVGEIAYGTQTIKQTLDNDLLVDPADVPAVLDLLSAAGYELVEPVASLDRRRLTVLVDLLKECLLVHREHRAQIDLHWRALAARGLVDAPDLTRDVRKIGVEGYGLPTLVPSKLMIYLAMHGARHGWHRLKWLADFNALLAGMPAEDVIAMRDLARKEGAGQAMELALLQSRRLFSTPIPEGIGRSRRVRWLAFLSDEMMRGRDELVNQSDAPQRYKMMAHASGLLLSSRPRYLFDYVWAGLVATDHILALPLPRVMYGFYFIASPPFRIAGAAGRFVSQGISRLSRSAMRGGPEN